MEIIQQNYLKLIHLISKKLSSYINNKENTNKLNECLEIIEYCLKFGIDERGRVDDEIIKITIEFDVIFELFIKNYLSNDSEIDENRIELFDKI